MLLTTAMQCSNTTVSQMHLPEIIWVAENTDPGILVIGLTRSVSSESKYLPRESEAAWLQDALLVPRESKEQKTRE